MIFQRGRSYRHEKFWDVVMVPVSSTFVYPNGDCKVKCKWMLEGNANGYLAYDKILIKKEDVKKWKKI